MTWFLVGFVLGFGLAMHCLLAFGRPGVRR